jgi:hypothetical protein
VLEHGEWASGFGIWGAGKNGRKFYRQLPASVQQRVRCFYDVDAKKVCFYQPLFLSFFYINKF